VNRRWAILFFIFAIVSLAGNLPVCAQSSPPPAGNAGNQPAAPLGASGQIYSRTPSQDSFSGSVPAKPVPGVLSISLQDAINRGLKQNLGLLLSRADIGSARGERWRELSRLMPNVTMQTSVVASQVDLATLGIRAPGIPNVIGPFSYFDSRAYLSQSLFDWQAISRTSAATRKLEATNFTYKDARDRVILAVGFAYLQAIAGEARVATVGAQVKTARALSDQASDRLKAGTAAAIDALRAKVELQTRQQQWIAAQNDFAIQKLNLARVIGLAPGQEFQLADKSPFQPLASLTVDEALRRAYAARSDFQAASAEVRAAEYARKAAFAGYFPALSFGADYGVAGRHPASSAHGVFDVRGTLTIPIFQGGMVHGDILEADARLEQSRERQGNLRGQIDAEVRTALLNLESSAEQVAVAQSNVDLAEQTLSQARDRFAAGVTSNIEVVQAQEALAAAHDNEISSLYEYNFAKISLARALGSAEQSVREYFKGN
jgi:outer membrane protein TolC